MGKRKRILLVLDQAWLYTAKKKLRVPEEIHLEFLSTHSSELLTSEMLFALSKYGIANRNDVKIDEIEEAIV